VRSRLALACVALLAIAGGAMAASPDLVAQSIDAARAAWKKRDAAAAVRALEGALLAARADAPLEVRQAVVVHEPHTGLGLYTPAVDDVVRGRELKLYVEVAGFAAQPAEGGASVALEVSADFEYQDGNENVPLGTRPLGTQRFFTRTFTGLTSFGLDVRLGDKSPPGVYRMTLHVLDTLGGKRASKDVRFVLR
jgi:hypothetical protein